MQKCFQLKKFGNASSDKNWIRCIKFRNMQSLLHSKFLFSYYQIAQKSKQKTNKNYYLNASFLLKGIAF